jgi:predicted Zn-dependent protease
MLGQLEAETGRVDEAIQQLRGAATLDIHASKPFHMIAALEMGRRRPQVACDWENKAIKRDPDNPLEYLFLSTILDQLGRKQESEEAMRHAKELHDSARTTDDSGALSPK